MKGMLRRRSAVALLAVGFGIIPAAGQTIVTPPPESFFAIVDEPDRAAAREFYGKFLDIDGIPVAASPVVDDRALLRTREIVGRMLAGRPDVVQAMADRKMYLVVIGKDQVYTEMPEYRHAPDPAFLNERVRGTGGRPTSFGEENLLSLPLDRYDDESIAVHEFAHTIDGVLEAIDAGWRGRLREVYRAAMDAGLYRDAYAAGNAGEYWAEIVQSYFDCNRVNNWNHGPVGSREQLRAYDPAGYELARTTFRLAPDQDWRYSWLQKLPTVAPPPAKLGFNSYYTKATFARSFPVLGREAVDDALLKTNDVVRKMFAYRHDVLKALIDEGCRIVVLGPGESIADLPEWKDLKDQGVDGLSRSLEYATGRKLMVVGEESVLGDPSDPMVGADPVVRVLAGAILRGPARRPAAPERDPGDRRIQQYELRVKRLDVQFDERVKALYEAAKAAGKWRGTAAGRDHDAYWVEGVLAYFDAQGQVPAPADAPHPIVTREDLRAYDPPLAEFLDEATAYRGKVDWRLPRRHP